MLSKAVFTIVKNEKNYLPIWLKHYSKYFNPQDTYVLDHNTDDGSTDNINCNVIKLDHSLSFDVEWLLKQVMSMQVKLFKKYDIVLFSECDELVVPTKTGRFEDHLKKQDVVKCKGFEIIHRVEKEPALDWSKPLLRQRKWWAHLSLIDKPLLSKIPLRWSGGCHNCKETKTIDPDLLLIHIRRIDYETYKEKLRKFVEWKTPGDVNPDKERRRFIKMSPSGFDQQRFDSWFKGIYGKLQPIPEDIKDVI